MPRSTHIYLLSSHQKIIAAYTVKMELIDALRKLSEAERVAAQLNLKRVIDGGVIVPGRTITDLDIDALLQENEV